MGGKTRNKAFLLATKQGSCFYCPFYRSLSYTETILQESDLLLVDRQLLGSGIHGGRDSPSSP